MHYKQTKEQMLDIISYALDKIPNLDNFFLGEFKIELLNYKPDNTKKDIKLDLESFDINYSYHKYCLANDSLESLEKRITVSEDLDNIWQGCNDQCEIEGFHNKDCDR